MTDEADPIRIYMAEVERLCAADPRLGTLGAGILAGINLDIAHDSRSFARTLGIEHALVLREVEMLAEVGLLTVTKRDDRTQRCFYLSNSDCGVPSRCSRNKEPVAALR